MTKLLCIFIKLKCDINKLFSRNNLLMSHFNFTEYQNIVMLSSLIIIIVSGLVL